MAQLFNRQANKVARLLVLATLLVVVGLAGAAYALYRSPYFTGLHTAPEQPVPFSHRHHVGALGIDCRYCHTSVETSQTAGMPATDTCMSCHSQLWTDAEMLEPVRTSLANDDPIEWRRVHDVPDFVYFNHSAHINKGVGCVSCHGRVDKMALTYKAKTLRMDFCLDCHRNPGSHLRPRERVFDLDWQPRHPEQLRQRLLSEYDVAHAQRMTNCSTCHR